MDGKMYGFQPGEKVWIRGRESGEYIEATIASSERQEAYQAKDSWQEGRIVVMRRATGIIGKPVWINDLFHDGPAIRAFIEARIAEEKSLLLVRRYCATEGLVMGGKVCQQSPLWQTFTTDSHVRQEAEESLRTQVLSTHKTLY
jgi:hypothetical protein